MFDGLLLDFNERTIPVPVKVSNALIDMITSNMLNRYPEYGNLEEKLSQYTGVTRDQIVITNGSDQGIDMVVRTFVDHDDTIIIPTPSFSMYKQSAQIVGARIKEPFYNKTDMSFPLSDILDMITTDVKLIVICNPNNPTGTLIPVSDIERIARKASSAIILVDEAYAEFSGVSAVSLIEKLPNIIVTRTCSKALGLPSLRLGYLVATNTYIKELLKVRGPYDVNMAVALAASAALDCTEELGEYVNEVMNISKPLIETFFNKNKIDFYPSSANFILYKPLIEHEAEILKHNSILVRPQDKKQIEGTIRLTIGTEQQMKRFIKIYANNILPLRVKKKVAFIDRDGTIIHEPQDTYQIDSIEKLKILPGVTAGLKKLMRQGYHLILISNQDGLGTPSFPQEDFDEPHNKMLELLKKDGIVFDEQFICPHISADNCSCRKPKTGLVQDYLAQNTIDFRCSLVCGDRDTDRQFAENIGVSFISMKTNGNFMTALMKGTRV